MRPRESTAVAVPRILTAIVIAALIGGCATTGGRRVTAKALDAIVIGPNRPASDLERDRFRHPVETLLFFGIRPDSRVLLLWPKSGYYTRIIAPLVRARGRLYAGVIPRRRGSEFLAARLIRYRGLLASDPSLFDRVKVVDFPLDGEAAVPPGSVDLVLAIRDLHEWMALGAAKEALGAIYRALAPGGVLGVVDNRAAPSKPQDPRAKSGYVRQDYAIRLVEAAGFRLVATSEVNANPKDTKNYPIGVWALPPAYRLGTIDRRKYAAIGESDRFTLKFVKPAGRD